MQPCYAVVDLETTGNQLETDAIIQIGITFVRNNEIIDTYHSMVNTNIEIPPFIQALTAIEQEMIDQAPYFKDIAQTVHAKLQDCIFVAHNVAFDLNFIQRALKTVISITNLKKCWIHLNYSRLLFLQIKVIS